MAVSAITQRSRTGLFLAALAIAGLVLAACGSSAATSSSGGTSNCKHGRNGKPCRVVMVVPAVANDFRVQEQRVATAEAKKSPFSTQWDFSLVTSDNTPEAQNAVITNVLAQGVDALLIEAVSDHSADDLVKSACGQGVVVIGFDSPPQTGACEVREAFDGTAWGRATGEYFGKATGCKGTFLYDKGIQGIKIQADVVAGETQATKDVCGSNVKIAYFFSEFNVAKSETEIGALLATNPDVSAVMNTACASTYKVFKAAGRPIPVLGCQGYNADVLTLVQQPGVNGIATAASGAPSYGAMELAYKALKGEKPAQDVDWPSEFIVTDPSINVGVTKYPTVKAEIGKNAFPDLPGGFFVYYQWPNSMVPITLNDALGK